MAQSTPTYNPVTFDNVVLNSCIMCKNEGTMKCTQCGTRYCSVACQRQDWPCHQHLCKSFYQFTEDRRPLEPHNYRVILFPVKKNKPTFAWMKFDDDGQGPDALSASALLGASGGSIPPGDGPFRAIGLRLNRSILWLSRPGHTRVMYGAVVFLAFTRDTTEVDCWKGLRPHDATFRDFRSAIDFLLFQQVDCVGNTNRFHALYGLNNTVQPAVKINCRGDCMRYLELGYYPELFETVIVPAKPITQTRKTSYWTSKLGLSWVWQSACYKEDLDAEAKYTPNVSRNAEARFFVLDPDNPFYQDMFHDQINIDPASGTFAIPRTLLNLEFGSIIVVHEKGLPIHPMHVSVFVEFVARSLESSRSLIEVGYRDQKIQLFEVEALETVEMTQRRASPNSPIHRLPSPYIFESSW
ncbi:hypothetical protein F4810DRAFT_699929 [Camillea tinctor]|nr:hypothetical protein F4810DRAFT_699929 [Camillea tinctor]